MLDDKLKRTLKCMMIGSLVYSVALLILSTIIFIIFCKSKNLSSDETFTYVIKNEVCVVIGFICSIVSLYSMAVSLSTAVSANDEKYAKKHIALMSIVRLVVFCLILIFLINKNTFGLSGGIMFAISMLGIKVGAYLAPMIDKKL